MVAENGMRHGGRLGFRYTFQRHTLSGLFPLRQTLLVLRTMNPSRELSISPVRALRGQSLPKAHQLTAKLPTHELSEDISVQTTGFAHTRPGCPGLTLQSHSWLTTICPAANPDSILCHPPEMLRDWASIKA